MQLIVNVSYGVPLAAGLWIIGVPGALLWGAVGAVMRFVPYVGPLIAAIFPIALAFAVDSGWSMLLWTVALIVVLELISNNIVEPLLYGSSTGLSAISLIAAAILWTALWGPRGTDPLHPPHGLPAGSRAQSAAAALPRHHARLDACTRCSGPHLSAADCK